MNERPFDLNPHHATLGMLGRLRQITIPVIVNEKTVLCASQRAVGFEYCRDQDFYRHDNPIRGFPRLHVPIKHPADNPISWKDCGCSTIVCPRASRGDTLWFRETWRFVANESDDEDESDTRIEYKVGGWQPADMIDAPTMNSREAHNPDAKPSWKSPVLMPKSASRLSLRVSAVFVTRIKDLNISHMAPEIGVEDEYAIGSSNRIRNAFVDLWDSQYVHGYPYSTNPYVWQIRLYEE